MNKNTIAAAAVIAALLAILVWRTSTAPKEVAAPTVQTEPLPPKATAQPEPPPPPAMPSASSIPLGAAMGEAKKIDEAQTALRAGDPKRALAALESYDRYEREGVLRHEATLLRVEALAGSGRKTDALALAMRSREDPSFAPYRDRLDAILADAGL
jgi:hypothetical protein